MENIVATAPVLDPATQFVHDCIRMRMRPDDHPLVTAYVEQVFREGRRDHTVRVMETLRLLCDRQLLLPSVMLAETGSLGDVGDHLVAAGYRCEQVKGDLRVAFDAPDARYDLLLSLEVFEHIKDQDPARFDDLVVFNDSGVRRFAEECRRILRPGGRLVLSTPNACSLFSLMEILQGRPPMLWRQHVREFSIEEVTNFFTACGFELEYVTDWFAYHFLNPHDIEPLFQRYLDPAGASRDNRGDDLCFIFRRL